MDFHDYHLRGYEVVEFGSVITLDLVYEYPGQVVRKSCRPGGTQSPLDRSGRLSTNRLPRGSCCCSRMTLMHLPRHGGPNFSRLSIWRKRGPTAMTAVTKGCSAPMRKRSRVSRDTGS